ncbi:hypothetical protein BC830DRAFT_1106698 [Chytriomyces sp. MP71]|nr:hypothetical protein BC830DRAFT_1106698 [Chytriomyces sp. MP71]
MDDLDHLLSDLEAVTVEGQEEVHLETQILVETVLTIPISAPYLPNKVKPIFQSRSKSSSQSRLNSLRKHQTNSISDATLTPSTSTSEESVASAKGIGYPSSAQARSLSAIKALSKQSGLEAQVALKPQLDIKCQACQLEITSLPYVTSPNGLVFHPNHFTCTNPSCKRALKGTVYIEEPATGDAYCKTCFAQLFSETCFYCKDAIFESCVKACSKSFHPSCFFCSNCGGLLGCDQAFVEEAGKVYCIKDYDALFGKVCKGCNVKCGASEEIVSLVDRNVVFHLDCFKCHVGGCPLRAHEFYEDETTGLPVCQAHFYGSKDAVCHACEKIIVGACVNALGRRYHRACFTCTFCKKGLEASNVSNVRSGNLSASVDRFMSKNGHPYCPPCHLKLFG